MEKVVKVANEPVGEVSVTVPPPSTANTSLGYGTPQSVASPYSGQQRMLQV